MVAQDLDLSGRAPLRIKTPDQRLRVFISSTLNELADERNAAREAVGSLKLTPVMFELGARPHAPKALYRSYLDQSHVFVGIYWKSYGWVAPDMEISGLEDEYVLAAGRPKLIYIKKGDARDPELRELIDRIRTDDTVSYKYFTDAAELRGLIEDDLALLLTERFEASISAVESPETMPASNLPALINLFVGRSREIGMLTQMVKEEGVRLVTLTGPGGIGKSRLALEFATAMNEHFEGRAHLVLLQAVQDPALVASTIAQTLQVPEIGGVPTEKVLVEELADKTLLLVLDNFEHLLSAAAVVSTLVMGCPKLVILVTSRSPLNLRGERELAVPPLDVPTINGTIQSAQLDQYDAVRLFIDRARSAKPDFEVSNLDAPAVADICHRLDGIPLAIELAAARVRLLPPEAMRARLKDRFALLKGGWRDLPERHKTLRSTIDWSFDLLDTDEKYVFIRASAFNGGWTLDAIEQVCDPDGERDVLTLVASLVEKSLVYSSSGGLREPRFAMLETIREYARILLKEADDFTTTMDRHARVFMGLIEEAGPRLRSSLQQETLDRLEDEHSNIRSALQWLIETDRNGEAAEMAWHLWHFWWLRDHIDEGSRATDEILRSENLNDRQRAGAVAAKGCMAFWAGDYAATVELLNDALATFREIGYEEGAAFCQLPLAIIEGAVIGPKEALPRLSESRAIFERLGNRWGSVLAQNAKTYMCLGLHMEVTSETLEDTVSQAQELGTEVELGMAYGNLGIHRCRTGALPESASLLMMALDLLSKNRIRNMCSYTIDQVAELALETGDGITAARLMGAAEAIRTRAGAALAPAHEKHRLDLIEHTRGLVGGSAFDAAYAAGAELTFTEAVREAKANCSERMAPARISDAEGS